MCHENNRTVLLKLLDSVIPSKKKNPNLSPKVRHSCLYSSASLEVTHFLAFDMLIKILPSLRTGCTSHLTSRNYPLLHPTRFYTGIVCTFPRSLLCLSSQDCCLFSLRFPVNFILNSTSTILSNAKVSHTFCSPVFSYSGPPHGVLFGFFVFFF